MLLSFSVSNFKSFRDEQTLDLRASGLQPAFSWLENAAVEVGKEESALRVKALYGANASGKSNMIAALRLAVNIIGESAQNTKWLSYVKPFSFDGAYLQRPTTFEFTFSAEGHLFRYGFSCNANRVFGEWLFDESIRKARIFERIGQEVKLSKKYFERVDAVTLLKSPDNKIFRTNSLFLSSSMGAS